MPKVAHIEKTVRSIEGFEIRIMYNNGTNVRGDKSIPKQYVAGKMSKSSFAVGDWKAKFQSQFPGYEVQVLNADGSVARGTTLLSTVRATYSI